MNGPDPKRSSWQIFDVSEIDTECVRRAFSLHDGESADNSADVARANDRGAQELQRVISKHRREARLYEIDKMQGEYLALTEAAKQFAEAGDRVLSIAKEGLARTRLARVQAMQGVLPEDER